MSSKAEEWFKAREITRGEAVDEALREYKESKTIKQIRKVIVEVGEGAPLHWKVTIEPSGRQFQIPFVTARCPNVDEVTKERCEDDAGHLGPCHVERRWKGPGYNP